MNNITHAGSIVVSMLREFVTTASICGIVKEKSCGIQFIVYRVCVVFVGFVVWYLAYDSCSVVV